MQLHKNNRPYYNTLRSSNEWDFVRSVFSHSYNDNILTGIYVRQ